MNGKDIVKNAEEYRMKDYIDYVDREITTLKKIIPIKQKMLSDFENEKLDLEEMAVDEFTKNHPKH